MLKFMTLIGMLTIIGACDVKKESKSERIECSDPDVSDLPSLHPAARESVKSASTCRPTPSPLPFPSPTPLSFPDPFPEPLPIPEPTPVPVPSPEPAPVTRPETSPAPTLPPPIPDPSSIHGTLEIRAEGQGIVGEKLKFKTFLIGDMGSQNEVPAKLTLIVNQAEAEWEDADVLIATRHGRVIIDAAFGNRKATAAVQFHYPAQFWVYREDGNKLLFNTPWDEEEGDEIKWTTDGLPNFAIHCLRQSRAALEKAEAESGFNWTRLNGLGAPDRMIYLVNVVSSSRHLTALRAMDRDAYFWLWSRQDMRPYLAMSDFKQGTFVWEVVASPQGCIQPSLTEAGRYLDYVTQRLTKNKRGQSL